MIKAMKLNEKNGVKIILFGGKEKE